MSRVLSSLTPFCDSPNEQESDPLEHPPVALVPSGGVQAQMPKQADEPASSARATRASELSPEAAPCMPADAQHPQAIRENLGHLCDLIDSLLIMYGHLDDLEMQLAGPEQQFIVAPQVLDVPNPKILLQAGPVFSPQDLVLHSVSLIR